MRGEDRRDDSDRDVLRKCHQVLEQLVGEMCEQQVDGDLVHACGWVLSTIHEHLGAGKVQSPHHCENAPTKDNMEGYGEALTDCYERSDGSFWVGNGEYGSRVNFCPYCGAKAPNQMEVKP